MKLTVDFSALWKNANRMGSGVSDFSLGVGLQDLGNDLFDTELSSTEGVEIDLSELEIYQGVLSVKGRQVLLFIPDQHSKIEAVLGGNSKVGTRFHIADCQTLDNMRNAKRFDRYKVTNNLGGRFRVYGWSKLGANIDGEAELNVCMNCLKYLNYKGFGSISQNERYGMVSKFDIGDFLTSYSTLFKSYPKKLAAEAQAGGYSKDWSNISQVYRTSVNYCCESCDIDLSDNRGLLHTHHISGNKRDNRPENLQALCVDCHRKQPLHGHMFVKYEDMRLITRLRRERGSIGAGGWREVYAMADQALEGLLHYYEKRALEPPKVGYVLKGDNDRVVAELDIAWPSKRRGIAMSPSDIEAAQSIGWKVLSVGDAIRNMNERRP